MTAAVLRFEVPVDDRAHPLVLPSKSVLHVAARRPDVVELWCLDPGAGLVSTRWLRVFGTGQPLPAAVKPADYVGTALAGLNGALVWHLFEVPHPVDEP